MRERNEALDCRVYARAAAWLFGAERWPESTWQSLEAQVGIAREEEVVERAADAETQPPPEPTAGQPRTPRRKRRVYTPNMMR